MSLEEKQAKAWTTFQAAAKELEALPPVSTTAKDNAARRKAITAKKAQVEELQLQYEATKKIKEDKVLGEIDAKIKKARNTGGLTELKALSVAAGVKARGLANKAREFPTSKKVGNALLAAKTEVELIEKSLGNLAKSDDVSVRESAKIAELEKAATEQEAYNRLYAEALPIARGGV